MSFCLNPACPKPNNPDTNKSCQGCGSKLAESTNSYNFEHYKVIKLLGEGGFGRTYLAEDLELFNKKVVIKKIIAIDANNPKILELFSREAEQLYQLSHPQIPKSYRYFNKDNNFYLIQEFIPGENLLKEFERKGSFSEVKIIEILQKILLILEYIQILVKILDKMVEDSQKRRYQDAKEVRQDLADLRSMPNNVPPTVVNSATGVYQPETILPTVLNNISKLANSTSNLVKWFAMGGVGVVLVGGLVVSTLIMNNSPRAYSPLQPERTQSLNTAKSHYHKGIIYYEKKLYELAIKEYDQAIALDPNYVDAYVNRGLVYSLLEDYNQAITDYGRAIALDPNYALPYYNRGVIYGGLGQYLDAIYNYNRAIKLAPNYIDAYYNRGVSYAGLGQYYYAITDYDKAIELNPNYTNAYSNRGVAYYNREQYQVAIEDYNKVIELDPDDYLAYNNRGLAYVGLQMFSDAVVDYSKAIQLNPDYADTYNNRGVAYYNLRDYQKAIADYEQAIRLNPNHPLAISNLESLRRELGI